ncbi:MAG: Do family serine endopeptidase [Verrucomicrobiota bacterium]
MKRKFIYQVAVALVCAITMGAAIPVQAETGELQNLKSNLKIDKGEGDAPGIATYAPSLEKVMPTVVTISATKSVRIDRTQNSQQEEMLKRFFDIPDELLERYREEAPERQQQGLGSGVVISPNGYILTNNHVVSDADEVTVTLPETQKEYSAEIVGGDPRTDVALLKIDATGLKQITIGDSSKLRIGDVVLAVGNPLTLEQSASIGIVSALGRDELNITNGGYENFIQTDAAINRGNSGGALVDASGRLIGINTAIQSNFSGGNIGIGFAIPINMALNIAERLVVGEGVVKRGFLGVFLREVDENFAKALGRDEQSGVLVTEVGGDTPAADAGMKPGDLIVAYNGTEVDDMQKLRLDISNTAPGSKVKFSIVRNGKDRKVEVVLGDLEAGTRSLAGAPRGSGRDAQPQEFVEGVRIKDLDEETRTALQLDENIEGVVVESVKDNVPAAEAGLRPGTVITQIDQNDVSSVAEAFEIVEGFEADVLLLQVYAAGRRDILAVPLVE